MACSGGDVVSRTDWSLYGTCPERNCRAEQGQPCRDLRNNINPATGQASGVLRRPHYSRPRAEVSLPRAPADELDPPTT